MPLYEYLCTKCGERTEVLQSLGAAPPSQCPRCGGALEKQASAPALQFKGTGWYVTDYTKRSASADSADSAKPPAAKPEQKSESKPAAPDSKPPAPDSKTKAS